MVNIEEIQTYDINKKVNRITLLEKLYIWSLITEPLLFFVLSSSAATGLPLTLSRILQLSFLMLYLMNFLLDRKKIPNINSFYSRHPYVTIYICLIILSSLIGLITGEYLLESNVLNESAGLTFYLRPFLESFILLYYFVYFLILPMYMIRTNVQLTYLFKWILRVFYFVIVIGLIDVLCNVIGFDVIPRHLVDSRWVKVGSRFHSILGEPRDAFVYMMFMISILYLYAGVTQKPCPKRITILIILACAFLTKSFSGIVGIMCSIVLYVMFTRLSIKNYMMLFSVLLVSIVLGFVAVKYSPRIQQYFYMATSIPQVMQSGAKLPYLVYVQSPDIVPLWLFLNKILNLELFSVLFGSGIGSASFATNNFMDNIGVNNPRAQITRLIYESGLVGTYVYLMIIITPARRLKNMYNKKNQLLFWLSVIFMCGAVLGHRSNVALIFSGVVLSILLNKLYVPRFGMTKV